MGNAASLKACHKTAGALDTYVACNKNYVRQKLTCEIGAQIDYNEDSTVEAEDPHQSTPNSSLDVIQVQPKTVLLLLFMYQGQTLTSCW